MKREIDYKALTVGVFIYFIGSYILPIFVAVAFVALDLDIESSFLRNNEFVIDLIFMWIIMLWAGYYTQKLSRKPIVNHSLVLGMLLFALNIIGTIAQINDSKSDPFLWNFLFDVSIIVMSYMGGVLSDKRNKRLTHNG